MRRVQVGDRVTVPFVCGCGKCSLCCSGNAQVCEEQWQPGFHGPGCWAQFVRVSQVLLVLHVLARVVLRPIEEILETEVGFSMAFVVPARDAAAWVDRGTESHCL